MTGKEKCKLLREIRREIAEANGIVYLSAECTHDGECAGTCPKCDAEVRYLDSELNRMAEEGKKITLAGLSLQTFDTFVPQKEVSENPLDLCDISFGDFTSHGFGYMAEGLDDGRLEMPIEELDIPVRAYNCLKRANINTVSDICSLTERDLLRVRNLGRKCAEEVMHKLSELGFSLAEEESPEEIVLAGAVPPKEPVSLDPDTDWSDW